MNLKDRKIPFIAGGAAVAVILLLLIFMPSDKSGDQGQEVISKRVKIELQDTEADIYASTDISASADVSSAGADQPATPTPAAVVQGGPPAQAKPEGPTVKTLVPPAPAETVKEVKLPPVKKAEPKQVKTVKTEKKKTLSASKPAARRITADNAWALNIASFPSLSEAQGLAGKLKKGGYNAYVTGFTKDSIKWHRVRVGFFASRDEAARAGKAIQSKFRVDKPWIAKPDAAELRAHL